MALTSDHLQTACTLFGAATSLRDGAALWRARYPDIRTIIVDAMDMRDESPALELGHRRVYLAASDGHCWQLTQRPELAAVLVLTEE